MSGTLYVVATPIGNLEDITLRALRVLREVQVIAAEDTRRTARLLSAHSILTPTISFHAHNARTRLPRLMHQLQQGRDIALVTDAGTPGVSDPGVEFVRGCVDAGLKVDVVPGPTAPIAAAVVSGFSLNRLTLLGFVPRGRADRKEFWREVLASPGTVCFFETPHRIAATLQEMVDIFGERQILVARELTKVHQEFLRGTPAEVLSRMGLPRGEFTLVVDQYSQAVPADRVETDAETAIQFGLSSRSTGATSKRGQVVAFAKTLGRPARDVYAALERAKLSPSEEDS